MSAPAIIDTPDFAAGMECERKSFIAYLEARRAGAEAYAKQSHEGSAERTLAEDRIRQIAIMLEEIRQGLHDMGDAA